MDMWKAAALAPLMLMALSGTCRAEFVQQGSYLWQNISAAIPSTLAAAYSASGSAELLVLSSQEFRGYSNGMGYTALYNSTVDGSGVVTLNVMPGEYYIVVEPRQGGINGEVDGLMVPQGSGRLVSVSGKYSYQISASNYSIVNASWIGSVPMEFSFDGYNSIVNGSVAYTYPARVNRGVHYMNFTPVSQAELFIYVNVSPALVNPIDDNVSNALVPVPIGMASYGLYNDSGVLIPYQVMTDEIEGGAVVNSISAYNALPPTNASAYGASIQLNTVMNVESGGTTRVYWLQNVMVINTLNRSFQYTDNIWNYSGYAANLSDLTLRGNGRIINSTIGNRNGSLESLYAYALGYTNYSYPLSFYPVTSIVSNAAGGPVVRFGYYNGSGLQYYDNVSFLMPKARAYMLVTPFYMTPSGNLYDSELVFGGASGGEVSTFSELNASLRMYYDSNGSLSQFPALYTFGQDAEEAAIGIRSVQDNATVSVGLGTPTRSSVIYDAGERVITTTVSTTTSILSTSTEQAAPYAPVAGPAQEGGTPPLLPISIIISAVVVAGLLYIAFKRLGDGRAGAVPAQR